MRDMKPSNKENGERINSWIFVLLMRLYGQNVYSDDSYIWKLFDLETTHEIDKFFETVLADFKTKRQDISDLLKIQQKVEEILGR